jgi:aspartyl-tRNA(Asn)/glutamyl-tRNA(Gln) amidotransferase subunit C
MSDFQIDKISKLAAIKLTEEEKNLYSQQLVTIFQMLDKFDQIDTEGVEPLRTVNNQTLVTREDLSHDPHSKETVLPSANHLKYNFFVTPKVIEE